MKQKKKNNNKSKKKNYLKHTSLYLLIHYIGNSLAKKMYVHDERAYYTLLSLFLVQYYFREYT